MELADLPKLYRQYRVKQQYARRHRNDLLPHITALNQAIAAITPPEFHDFLAQINHNHRSIAYLNDQFRRWQQVIYDEAACLSEGRFDQLGRLVGEDVRLFRQICRTIQAHYAENRTINVIGYGELSTTLVLSDAAQLSPCLQPEPLPAIWVYKSMPPFPSAEVFEQYEQSFHQYLDHLHRLGLVTPEQRLIRVRQDAAGLRVYLRQRRLDSTRIGHVLLQSLDQTAALTLIKKVIDQLCLIFAANAENQTVRLGFDGQLSNWYFPDLEPETKPLYFDTGTPLLRLDGREQMDPELFLKATPSFLRAIIRTFFLQSVLDRYYDFRSVIIDLLANLYKEGRGDLVGPAIEMVNKMIEHDLRPFDLSPLTLKEIRAYYRQDAFILGFFLMARRADKFITETIFRRPYQMRLPGKIKR